MASPRTASFNGLPEPVSPVNIKRRSKTSWLDDDDGEEPSQPERTTLHRPMRSHKKLAGDKRRLLDIVGPFQGPLCSLEDEVEKPEPSSPSSPDIVERSKSSQGNYATDFTSFPVSRWLGETQSKKPWAEKKTLLSPEFEMLASRFRGLGTEEAKTYRSKREAVSSNSEFLREAPISAAQERRTRDSGISDEGYISQRTTIVVKKKEEPINKEFEEPQADYNTKPHQIKEDESLGRMMESISTMPDDYEEHEQSDSTISFSSDSDSEPSDNDERDDNNSLHSECSYIVIDFDNDTGTHSRSQTESSGNPGGKGKQPAVTGAIPRRRSSTDQNESDQGEFSDSSERRRKRPRRNESNTSPDSGDVRKFACPYYRFNPEDPVHAKCKSRAFPTLARVKGHVLRTHLKPLQCERCCIYRAGDMGQISKHLQKNNCVKINKFVPMDREVERKGKALSRAGRIKTWEEVCTLIFECGLDRVPPAYVDSSSTTASPRSPEGTQPSPPAEEPLDALVNDTKFHSFVQDQLSRALSNMLPALLSQQLPTLIAQYCHSQNSTNSSAASASASFMESSPGNSFQGQSSSGSGSFLDSNSVDHSTYGVAGSTNGYPEHNRPALSDVQPLPPTVYAGSSRDNTHSSQQNTEYMPMATSSSTNYFDNTQGPNFDGMFETMEMDLGLFGGWETHVDEDSMI